MLELPPFFAVFSDPVFLADLQMAHAMNLGDGAVQRFLREDPLNRPDVNPMCLPAPAMAVTIVQGGEDEIGLPLSPNPIVPLFQTHAWCSCRAVLISL